MVKLEELMSLPGWDTRRKILESLSEKPKTAYELSKELDLNYSTVRYHLELLEKFGFVKARKTKKYVYEVSLKNLEFYSNQV
ncbi:ArsR family transcriptional regulator [Sulfolobus acidocaldarius SUSAZ]|nr:ArsR family transcriptional regulator [Sulfolobus acidocaldarius SUSAZ]